MQTGQTENFSSVMIMVGKKVLYAHSHTLAPSVHSDILT